MWCEFMGFRSLIKKVKIMVVNFVCGGSIILFIDFLDDLLNYLLIFIFIIVKDLIVVLEKRYIIECKDILIVCLFELLILINIIMDWIYDFFKIQSELGLDSELEVMGKIYKLKCVIWQKINGFIFGDEFKIERGFFYINVFIN